MNKRELVDAISRDIGGKKAAGQAVNAVFDAVQDAVSRGERVAITGFGVFEKVERPARYARNPATGERIRVKKTSVPRFRPGSDFKAAVSGTKKRR